MAIKSIRVSNFKSFRELEVELGPFTVLIGANASGKSNFVQVFRFVRDIANDGLRNAVSMQGGVEYLRNIKIGSSKDLELRAVSDEKYKITVASLARQVLVGVRANEVTYEFAISFSENGSTFEVGQDKLTLKCQFVELKTEADEVEEVGDLGCGDVTLSSIAGKLEYDSSLPQGISLEMKDLFSPYLDAEMVARFVEQATLSPRALLAETPFFTLPFLPRESFLEEISIYDFDPKLPKQAIPITGKIELEEDGRNLAIALRSILEDEEKRRKFLNLLKDVLGFVDGLRVMPLADRSLLFSLQESYTRDAFLPASFLSDGTIHVVALIIALYFDDNPLVIIEEPERNIHPFLIARVVDMLKEASEKKQIIVTTHNPEVVKHAGVENILLVSRDKEGFSTITRPSDSEQVVVFLKNEIGIEDLFVQDLLGA